MVSCIERPENFSHQPEGESRSYYNYAGLKNQGATCYMNSMIQQLYTIPSFRYLLLSVNDHKDEDLNSIEDEKSVYHNKMFDDNLLHQFQNTLAFLEVTERPYYNNLGLCFAMKDYSGEPTNCSLQQDSREFVNLAMDRLETLLKPTPQRHIISDTFSHKQCTHMTCSNCGFVKQRIEDYYILSLPVKKFSNLEESLNAYTDGEIISDFRCDNCEQKVDINKRCSFVDMPNILMVHLQKIVFNLDTFMNEKIADRYEFPTYLDMENYMVEKIAEKHGINDPNLSDLTEGVNKNFEYRLTGVIIHQGVAEAGHYYSLICTDSRLRDKDNKTWMTTEGMKWTEFNDTTIKDFNFNSHFEDECYGKNTKEVYGGYSSGDAWGSGGSSKSAYVLIYEKREYDDIKLQVDLEVVKAHGKTSEQVRKVIEEDKRSYLKSIYSSYNYSTANESTNAEDSNMEINNEDESAAFKSSLECGDIAIPRDLFPYLVVPHNVHIFLNQEQKDNLKFIPVHYDKESDECYISIKFTEVQKYIPKRILKKVWDDNNIFVTERQINNSDFFQFFKNTLREENLIEQQDNQAKFSQLYDLCLKMIFDMLVYAFHNESIIDVGEVFKKILLLSDDSLHKFSDYILVNNSSEFIRILLKCSEFAVRMSVSKILSTAINRMFDKVELIEKAEKFMNHIFHAVQADAASNWTKFENLFELIEQVAIGGEAQLEFMKKNHIETLLADFFLAEKSPIRPENEKRMCMGNNYSKPNTSALVNTICYLSRHTNPKAEVESQGGVPQHVEGNNCPHCKFFGPDDSQYAPGENERKVIVNKHFAAKAIKDAFAAEEVGKLLAHWSYHDEEASAIFAAVFVRGINETDYDEVAPFLTAMKHFLGLRDEFQGKRIEWLLGTPMLIDGSMIKTPPTDKPKLGIYACQTLTDEVYYFPSTIDGLDASNESILSLIWRSKRRFENYTILCIKELLGLGDDIMRYVCSMPSPTYQYARYTDWIFQFIEDKRCSNSKDLDMYRSVLEHVENQLALYQLSIKGYEDDLKEQHKVLYDLTDEELQGRDPDSNMEVDEAPEVTTGPNQDLKMDEENKESIMNILEDDDQESHHADQYVFPRPYVIGRVINETEVLVKSTDHIRVVVSELECDWAWHHPQGKKKTSKEFFDYYIHRKGDISSWNKKPSIKNSMINTSNANESFVELGHHNQKNEDMSDQVESSNLKPIGEEDEGDIESGWQHDEDINNELNDREQVDASIFPEDNAEVAKHQNLLYKKGYVWIEDEWIPVDKEDVYNVYEDKASIRISSISKIDHLLMGRKERKREYPQKYKEEVAWINGIMSGDGETIYKLTENANEHPNQQDDQENEEEIVENIEEPSSLYTKSIVVLRVSIYNFYKKKIQVEINLNSSTPAPNFHCPLCPLKTEVYANKAKTVAYFHKIHPNKPFGKYSFTYYTDAESQALLEEEAKKNQDLPAAVKSTSEQGVQGSAQPEDTKIWSANEDDFAGIQDEISCEVCTLFNPITASKCSVCDSPLPHKK